MLQIVHTILNYVIAHWPAISALVGGGAGLSVLLEFVLHKLRIDSKKVAYALLHVFSIVIALSAYYIDNKSVLPAYAGLAIAAQTIHRFAVSPWYSKYIQPYLTFLSEQAPVNTPAANQARPAVSAPAAPSFVN